MKNLGKKIRLMRQEKGWTQTDFADKMDISVPAFSKIESGITDINLSRLEQISSVMGLTVIEMLTDQAQDGEHNSDLQEAMLKLREKDSEVILLQQKVIELLEELRVRRSIRQQVPA